MQTWIPSMTWPGCWDGFLWERKYALLHLGACLSSFVKILGKQDCELGSAQVVYWEVPNSIPAIHPTHLELPAGAEVQSPISNHGQGTRFETHYLFSCSPSKVVDKDSKPQVLNFQLACRQSSCCDNWVGNMETRFQLSYGQDSCQGFLVGCGEAWLTAIIWLSFCWESWRYCMKACLTETKPKSVAWITGNLYIKYLHFKVISPPKQTPLHQAWNQDSLLEEKQKVVSGSQILAFISDSVSGSPV